MAGKSLSHLSSEATQKTNVTGETTPILEIDPTDGTLIKLLNQISTGDAPGIAIVAKFKDSNDNDLPADTKVILRIDRPTDDEPVPVSEAEDNIASWNGLTTAEQRNEEYIDQVKMQLLGAAVNVRDTDTLRVEINSSKQIDWNNAEFYFVREGVRELPFEG